MSTVAPGDGCTGATSTGTGSPRQHRLVERGGRPRRRNRVRGQTSSPGRTTKTSPTTSSPIGIEDLPSPSRKHAAPPSHRARGASGSLLPAAAPRAPRDSAEQDQRRDHGRRPRSKTSASSTTRGARQTDQDQAGERADRDERVHRRRPVPCVHERWPGGSRSRRRRQPASRVRTACGLPTVELHARIIAPGRRAAP